MKKCPYCGKEYPDDATVCVLDDEALESNAPPAQNAEAEPASPSPPRFRLDPPEGYKTAGIFEPFEAEQILPQIEKAGIRFSIEKLERSITPVYPMMFTKQVAVAIYVHANDYEKAIKILSEKWKV